MTNCANLVESAVKKIEGVKDASISFMTQKMKIAFDEGADVSAVMEAAAKTAKKIRAGLLYPLSGIDLA